MSQLDDHLGRLVAAEKNARAAIDGTTRDSAEIDQLRQKVARLEAQLAQLSARVDQMPGQLIALTRGTGPTT